MAEGLPGTSRVNVKGLRERLGLNQVEFADKMHVDQRTVRRWEHGQVKPSPMAMAHMRTLVRPKADGQTQSDTPSAQHHDLTQSLMSSAPTESSLPRRRLPTL